MATGDRYRDRETGTAGDAAGDADHEGPAAEHPPLGDSAEAAVAFQGKDGDFPGIAVADFSAAILRGRAATAIPGRPGCCRD